MSEDKSHREPARITRRRFIRSAAVGGALGLLANLTMKIKVVEAPANPLSETPLVNKPDLLPSASPTIIPIRTRIVPSSPTKSPETHTPPPTSTERPTPASTPTPTLTSTEKQTPTLTPTATLTETTTVTQTSTASPTEVPLTPVSELLKQTATAIAQNNEETSFRESDGFTKEIFEKIRRGTYVITIFFNDKSTPTVDGKGVGRIVGGTAWLAAVDKDAYYFVINRHVAKQSEISEINLWRPNIDQSKIVVRNFRMSFYGEGLDLAVIKCTGIHIPSVEVLNWKDNAPLQKGEKVLIVGFPQVFYNPNSDMKHSTLGSVATVAESINKTQPYGVLGGFSNPGSSGSPVVSLSRGIPEVAGIVRGGNDSVVIDKKRQPAVTINILAVQNLIDKTNE